MLKKRAAAEEYVIPALEGLWWAPDRAELDMQSKDTWLWTLMIMQPPPVTRELMEEALEELRRKKAPAAIDRARFEAFDEGLCAQIMHIGPYEAEEPTIARLHAFIKENGYGLRGKHHEIYMGDPRRTAPEKLKTVIRQPIK